MPVVDYAEDAQPDGRVVLHLNNSCLEVNNFI
jgi:hypothetical protein